MGSHRVPQAAWISAITFSKEAFSRSNPVTTTILGNPNASACFHARVVPTWMPANASTVITAALAIRLAWITCPKKSA